MTQPARGKWFRVLLLLACFGIAYVIVGVATMAVIVACDEWNERTWTPERIERTKDLGNSVLAAIERYCNDHGRCPPDLESLVLQYIDALPEPRAGNGRWSYSVEADGSSCMLSFGCGADQYPGCFFKWPEYEDWASDG